MVCNYQPSSVWPHPCHICVYRLGYPWSEVCGPCNSPCGKQGTEDNFESRISSIEDDLKELEAEGQEIDV